MRCHRIRLVAFVFFLLPLSLLTETSRAGTDPALDAAIARVARGQRLHVRTVDSVMLRGRFVLAAPDSIFLELHFPESKATGDPEVRTILGLQHDKVDAMWAFERQGLWHGLLWAGGTALAGVALMFAGGGDELESAVFISIATAVAVPVAFAWGAFRNKETEIYSRH